MKTKLKLMIVLVVVAVAGWAATVDAGPFQPSGSETCVPAAPCRTQADCGVHPATGQYLGLCGSNIHICLCY